MASGFSVTNPLIQRDPPDAVIYDLSELSHVTITLPTRSTWTSGLHWHERHVEYLRVVRGSIHLTLGGGGSASTRIISAPSGPHDTDTDTDTDTSAAEEVRIDRHVWHEWRRAEVNAGEDVVVVERTVPEDGDKTIFFWNLNGVVLTAAGAAAATASPSPPPPPYLPSKAHHFLLNVWVHLSLFTIFHDLDNFPVLVNVLRAFATRGFTFQEGTLGYMLLRSVDFLVAHVVLFVVASIARVVGVVAVRERFTPENARRRWAEQARQRKEGKRE